MTRMRKLNDMFHIDGDRLIKTSNGEPVPEDEPLFIFRGRDELARRVIWEYLNMLRKEQCDRDRIIAVDQAMMRFCQFAMDHPERMKQPGITKGR